MSSYRLGKMRSAIFLRTVRSPVPSMRLVLTPLHIPQLSVTDSTQASPKGEILQGGLCGIVWLPLGGES